MADNRFYRTDYPDFLLDELGNRFNAKNQNNAESPNNVYVNATIYGYDINTKDYTTEYAVFGDPANPQNKLAWLLTKYNNYSLQRTPIQPGGLFATGGSQPSATNGGGPAYQQTQQNQLVDINITDPTVEEENIAITNVKIDIGGRVGQVSRGEITITTSGTENLDIINKAVTQIGNRIELDVLTTWECEFNQEANRLQYNGRIHDFSFSLDSDKKFTVTLKMIGLAESLTQLNALPVFKPGSVSAWPKDFKPKDTSPKIPVDNLLVLLDALWDQEFTQNDVIGIKEVPGVIKTSSDVRPYMYRGVRVPGTFSDDYGDYINLEALRVIMLKIIDVVSIESDNKIANKLKLTYPPGAPLNINGSLVPYLDSANPDRILLFSNPITNTLSSTFTTTSGRTVTRTVGTDIYYAQPLQRYRYKSTNTATYGNIANIYISREVIFEAAGASLGDTRYDVAGNKSIEKFFESIFEAIKNETGGIIDLILLPELNESLTNDEQTTMYIVDRNLVTNTSTTSKILQFPLFPSDQHHFKDFSAGTRKLAAQVPKSLAAKAFVKDANLVANESSVAGPGETDDTTEIDPDSISTELIRLREAWPTSNTREQDSTKRRELMAKLWQRNIADNKKVESGTALKEASSTRNIQTGLDFAMTSYGINGWKWGHALSLDFIPSTAPGNTVFSINKISHDISFTADASVNSTWFTTVDCLARIRPQSEVDNNQSVTALKSTNVSNTNGPALRDANLIGQTKTTTTTTTTTSLRNQDIFGQ